MKLLQVMISEAPETLYATGMMRATGKLVLFVVHSIMARVANINQTVIATPAGFVSKVHFVSSASGLFQKWQNAARASQVNSCVIPLRIDSQLILPH